LGSSAMQQDKKQPGRQALCSSSCALCGLIENAFERKREDNHQFNIQSSKLKMKGGF